MCRKIILPFIFTCILFTSTFSQSTQLFEIDSFGANPGNLRLFAHTPKDVKSKKPLVVVIHGCGQNANEAASLSGWNKLADIHDFITIYPQQKILNNPNLCFNWFNANDVSKGSGECESIYEMIKHVQRKYHIDSTKIFVTGLSAGGAMSTVMMATHPELFNCGAIMAGGAYKIADDVLESPKVMLGKKNISDKEMIDKVLEQNPGYTGKFPKMIIYQGSADPVVSPKSTRYLINQWTGIHNCDTIADLTTNAYAGIKAITKKEFQNKKKETVVTFYSIEGLGHKLLIKPGDANNEGGKKSFFGVDIGYHSTFHVAKEFGILKISK